MLLWLSQNGWRPKRDTDDIITWAPRRYNVVADHLANAAMDGKCDWMWEDTSKIIATYAHGLQLKVCVDGGLRRSSGDASMAVAIFVAQDGIYVPVLYAAKLLNGVRSAFQSEAHSLEFALTYVIRVFGKT